MTDNDHIMSEIIRESKISISESKENDDTVVACEIFSLLVQALVTHKRAKMSYKELRREHKR